MRYFKQTIKDDFANGINGDCFRACVASIIGANTIDEVPHFFYKKSENHGSYFASDWLRSKGWLMLSVMITCGDSVGDALKGFSKLGRDMPYIFIAGTPKIENVGPPSNVAVIAQDGEIKFIPGDYIPARGLHGYYRDDFYKAYFITPIRER